MDKCFYAENRKSLFSNLIEGSIAVVFSGGESWRSADDYFPYFANRNFLYLTGINQMEAVLIGSCNEETLYIPPPDAHFERWNGERVKQDRAAEISGVKKILHTCEFNRQLDFKLNSGSVDAVYLPIYKHRAEQPDGPEHKLTKYIQDRYPHIVIKNLFPLVKKQRLIKKPCEVDALRQASAITKEGILAMMRAAKPGISERELKAEFLYAIMKHGAEGPAANPIISVGKNNFCIHYHDTKGVAMDGDFVLNDVGVPYDNLVTDVSRGWPINGRFSDRQKQLYQAAYEVSNYMFGIIKPGMPMGDVDKIIREKIYKYLEDIGLCKTWDDVGKYMWHGGAHHIGYDVHDVVAVNNATLLTPGMVFCVDIGIYVEEWGIGFRLEDNCLVTQDGCENLSKDIPRSIEDIEAVMRSA